MGQTPPEEGFEDWIIKFDSVTGNRDKERKDPKGYGAIEYLYPRMACEAGFEMMPYAAKGQPFSARCWIL